MNIKHRLSFRNENDLDFYILQLSATTVEARIRFGFTDFYTIEGGGHTWPGASDDSVGVGATTHEINASELIWDLFGRIRREP